MALSYTKLQKIIAFGVKIGDEVAWNRNKTGTSWHSAVNVTGVPDDTVFNKRKGTSSSGNPKTDYKLVVMAGDPKYTTPAWPSEPSVPFYNSAGSKDLLPKHTGNYHSQHYGYNLYYKHWWIPDYISSLAWTQWITDWENAPPDPSPLFEPEPLFLARHPIHLNDLTQNRHPIYYPKRHPLHPHL